MLNKCLKILEPLCLLLVPAALVLCSLFRIEGTALLTMLVAVAAMIPFFLRFERQRPRPRDIMPIVVLAAIAAAGRILFAPFPNFKPVTAILIVTAISFGKQSGFLTGALAALASNLFFGQGPWTPWQMYAWGLVGYLAGVLQEAGWFRKKVVVYLYGVGAALLFGLIMDTWSIIAYVSPITWQAAVIKYASGLPFTISHAVATVVFLVPILAPWTRKLGRIKRKFGIQEANHPQY